MTAVDWSRPIEAVHEGFDPQSAVLDGGPDQDGDYTVSWADKLRMYVRPTGEVYGLNWRIRNVQPTTTERDPALWDRMAALVRRIASHDTPFAAECRDIVADLPKLIDGDLLEARKIALSFALPGKNGFSTYATNRGDADNGDEVKAVLAAIKRGRQLAGEMA